MARTARHLPWTVTILVAVPLFTAFCTVVTGQNYYTELETLSKTQKEALQRFRAAALPIVPHAYMKEDIYLVKFLQQNAFLVKKSMDHLKEALKWRKDNNVDALLKNPTPEFEEIQREYPIYVDTEDKEGRPICEFQFGTWSVRKIALTGKIQLLTLHMLVRCGEVAYAKVREQQALGKNITQWIFMPNIEGFNIPEQGCPACLPFPAAVALWYEKLFPNRLKGLWFINTPDSFAVILRVIRPFMSDATRKAMKVFSNDWKAFVNERIDPSNLSDWFGGNKRRNEL